MGRPFSTEELMILHLAKGHWGLQVTRLFKTPNLSLWFLYRV